MTTPQIIKLTRELFELEEQALPGQSNPNQQRLDEITQLLYNDGLVDENGSFYDTIDIVIWDVIAEYM